MTLKQSNLIPPHVKRIFLTGGAGFIGSHVLDLLADTGVGITVYDNLSNGKLEYIEHHLSKPNIRFVKDDILNRELLVEEIKDHDLIWHLAANTDIINSHDYPARDLEDGVVGTFNVLDAMRRTGVHDMIFASSGAVYGSLAAEEPVTEEAGPLLPVSTYGAGKAGCEALISSFCNVYGLRAWMYRFGNVIGARMTHGVIFDFLARLKKDPSRIVVFGDGRQEKNYFLVEECLDGMLYGYREVPLTEDQPCDVYNLGSPTISRVVEIARIVLDEMGLTEATIDIEGKKKAWPGDQPRVHFRVDKFSALGWNTRLNSDQAVAIAVRRMLKKPGSEAWVL